MKSFKELQTEIAAFHHGLWKEMARPLLIGDHLSKNKREQYLTGMCSFDDLDETYKRTYMADAKAVLKMCADNIDTVVEYTYNGES